MDKTHVKLHICGHSSIKSDRKLRPWMTYTVIFLQKVSPVVPRQSTPNWKVFWVIHLSRGPSGFFWITWCYIPQKYTNPTQILSHEQISSSEPLLHGQIGNKCFDIHATFSGSCHSPGYVFELYREMNLPVWQSVLVLILCQPYVQETGTTSSLMTIASLCRNATQGTSMVLCTESKCSHAGPLVHEHKQHGWCCQASNRLFHGRCKV